jgi:hypothetical protein
MEKIVARRNNIGSVFLHIGIQRTGSTFLQEEIFEKLHDVNYFGFHNEQIIKILTNIENINLIEARKIIYEHLYQDKINLISEENIYGSMWGKDDNRIEKIDKIKNLFPQAKIIIGIRDKTDLLVSWYKKYIICGGVLRFPAFLEKIMPIEKLNYDPYIDYLIKLFGKENVYIYNFEYLKDDVHGFVDDLCDFIEVDSPDFKNIKKNIGYSFWQLKLSRILNHFFKTPFNSKGIFPLHYLRHPHRKIFQNCIYSKKFRGKEVTMNDLILERV